MKSDSRLSLLLHALLHMAERDTPITSETLSNYIGTNPVVIRRTMGFLREAGYVTSVRGHAGGWQLKVDLSSVTLHDLHIALGEPGIFAIGHRNERPDCLVEQVVNAALDDAFREAEMVFLKRMREVSLADLAQDFALRFGEKSPQIKDRKNVI